MGWEFVWNYIDFWVNVSSCDFFVYIKSYIINYYNHTTIINYQKFEKKYYFIEQGRIKLIKMTVKKCIMLQNNFILNKCCSYELSIHQRTSPPHPPILPPKKKYHGFYKNSKQHNYFQHNKYSINCNIWVVVKAGGRNLLVKSLIWKTINVKTLIISFFSLPSNLDGSSIRSSSIQNRDVIAFASSCSVQFCTDCADLICRLVVTTWTFL